MHYSQLSCGFAVLVASMSVAVNLSAQSITDRPPYAIASIAFAGQFDTETARDDIIVYDQTTGDWFLGVLVADDRIAWQKIGNTRNPPLSWGQVNDSDHWVWSGPFIDRGGNTAVGRDQILMHNFPLGNWHVGQIKKKDRGQYVMEWSNLSSTAGSFSRLIPARIGADFFVSPNQKTLLVATATTPTRFQWHVGTVSPTGIKWEAAGTSSAKLAYMQRANLSGRFHSPRSGFGEASLLMIDEPNHDILAARLKIDGPTPQVIVQEHKMEGQGLLRPFKVGFSDGGIARDGLLWWSGSGIATNFGWFIDGRSESQLAQKTMVVTQQTDANARYEPFRFMSPNTVVTNPLRNGAASVVLMQTDRAPRSIHALSVEFAGNPADIRLHVTQWGIGTNPPIVPPMWGRPRLVGKFVDSSGPGNAASQHTDALLVLESVLPPQERNRTGLQEHLMVPKYQPTQKESTKLVQNMVRGDYAWPATPASYRAGVGIADITGPATDLPLMGYAIADQVAQGILSRIWARAFYFEDDRKNKFVFVNTDLHSIQQNIRILLDDAIRGDPELVTLGVRPSHVMVSATHNHSGPGRYSYHNLYNYYDPTNAAQVGYYADNITVIVKGILNAIKTAAKTAQDSTQLYINRGPLAEAHRNRALEPYSRNPEDERSRWAMYYGNNGRLDDEMTTLSLYRRDRLVGAVAWYPVHVSNFGNDNHLVNGDNKGYASYYSERAFNGDPLVNDAAPLAGFPDPGQGYVVIAHAQANEGDVTPNTLGACMAWTDGGKSCSSDMRCDDWTAARPDAEKEKCTAKGPQGDDQLGSVKTIGQLQADKAIALIKAKGLLLSGPIGVEHYNISMPDKVPECSHTVVFASQQFAAAYGYNFGYGTADGHGDIVGTTALLWPTRTTPCESQQPKETTAMGLWFDRDGTMLSATPSKLKAAIATVVPVQTAQLGQLLIAGVPGEFTTMAGRRVRQAVERPFDVTFGGNVTHAVIAGLSNAYINYVTTPEEYRSQQYEGASTLYGRTTLDVFLREFAGQAESLTNAIIKKTSTSVKANTSLQPELRKEDAVELSPPKYWATDFTRIADNCVVATQVNASYKVGDVVTFKYYGGALRRMLPEDTRVFMTVQKKRSDSQWRTVRTDADWDTTVKSTWTLDAASKNRQNIITVSWTIPQGASAQTFRIGVRSRATANDEAVKRLCEMSSSEFKVQ